MKKNILIMAIAGLLIGFTACNKDENETGASGVDASKTSKINKGEPVNFKFTKAPEGSTVLWSVTPNKDVKINASGNVATILFSNSGSYVVNATYGVEKGSSAISVQDSVYKPSTGGSGTGELPTIAALTGDQVDIIIKKAPDSIGLPGLYFDMVTKNKYKCLNNVLLVSRTDATDANVNVYKIEFTGVQIPTSEYCAAGEAVAKGATYLYPIAEGESKLQITLNGTVYKGAITRKGAIISIVWTYTSGVTISPLTIN